MLIAAEGLCVGRGREVVAGPIDLALKSSEALVVTGPNGAGKSTLLRTLAGLLSPIAGRILVKDVDGRDGEPARTLAEIAHFLGHRHAMKSGLTVRRNLAFWRAFLGYDASLSATHPIDEALERVDLMAAADLPFSYLSAGQQRRASIARLIVAPRPLWILDEPSAALDMRSQGMFAELLDDHLTAGGVVIAATHQPLGIAARDLRLDPADRRGEDSDDEALNSAEGWL